MNENTLHQVKEAAIRWLPEIIRIRRDFHQHPELSFQEKRTSEKIKSFLTAHHISFDSGWAEHGIVAHIMGDNPGPTRMLRADMDALPILEENDVAYKSIHEGRMHACGHDVHSASLLGVAAILQEQKSALQGTVHLLFQPGEEKLPGGASIVLKEGLLKKFPATWIAAQHVFPSLPAGHVGFRDGLYMASADELYITVIGKGGHAATPHQCIDPVPITARLITALQELISRSLDPVASAVLTIGKINTEGGATNVIPDRVYLEGTLRAMAEDWRWKTHEAITTLVKGICEASGAKAEVRIETGYPCLANDARVTKLFREKAIEYLGKENVHDLPVRLTSEDFAFYAQEMPATFYRLGTGFAGKSNPAVHSSHFDIDENALETGMGLMAYVILSGE